ncbi:response regulator [Roseateles saccharophilus]|uniref:Response regulator receiver domain-containing protein n=1 Tax=Roseateles saccharophilus TaxID=304 RepID=A0A4R3UPA1_ROSSA|nr:response regulator [Roseateles saccharophilus]MDG0833504.1 response regulator [Roseateles saccharophilus]TCU92527.1 response regulator receiver domain-containing protein [Roseateles saccharophilus]
MSARILLVDDEPNILASLQRLMRNGLEDAEGGRYQVECFTDASAALARALECAFALVISDQRMPGMSGVEFLTALRQIQPDCGRIVLSGYADLNALMAAINEAAIDRFISKPWTDFELLSAVRQVLRIRELTVENQLLADQVRQQRGVLSAQEAEIRRLEKLEPGITHVRWGCDGSFILEDPGEVAP